MTLGKPGPGRVFLSRPLVAGQAGGRGALRAAWARRPSRSLRLWGWALGLLLLSLALGTCPGLAPDAAAAAAGAREQAAQTRKKPLHGQPWAFGQSEDRKDALWRRGVPAQSLKQRAVGATGRPPASGAGKKAGGAGGPAGKGAASRNPVGKGAMDTESGINSALSAAQAGAHSGGQAGGAAQGARPKGSLGLSMENETTTWNVTPMREAMRPDEVQARDSRHVVRAFADMEPTDDLSISVGPELILKDEQHGAESAGSSQPDSALGLGMQFKLDF